MPIFLHNKEIWELETVSSVFNVIKRLSALFIFDLGPGVWVSNCVVWKTKMFVAYYDFVVIEQNHLF